MLQAGETGFHALLLQGQPLNEPVTRYGPFVMYIVDTPRRIVKIPRRQGRSEPSDQAVFEYTVRERGERERRIRGISTMHFVMNTRDEIIQAVEDYQAGRMGQTRADVKLIDIE